MDSKVYLQGHIQAVCETGIPFWAPKLLCLNNTFEVLFFQLHFDKKYVEVAISNFTLHLIISKWLEM